MKDLDLIIDELKEYLDDKKTALGASHFAHAHLSNAILEMQNDIFLLEKATKLVRPDPAHAEQIIAAFQQDAFTIKARIDDIKERTI